MPVQFFSIGALPLVSPGVVGPLVVSDAVLSAVVATVPDVPLVPT
jgi:hypothetical protein